VLVNVPTRRMSVDSQTGLTAVFKLNCCSPEHAIFLIELGTEAEGIICALFKNCYIKKCSNFLC